MELVEVPGDLALVDRLIVDAPYHRHAGLALSLLLLQLDQEVVRLVLQKDLGDGHGEAHLLSLLCLRGQGPD